MNLVGSWGPAAHAPRVVAAVRAASRQPVLRLHPPKLRRRWPAPCAASALSRSTSFGVGEDRGDDDGDPPGARCAGRDLIGDSPAITIAHSDEACSPPPGQALPPVACGSTVPQSHYRPDHCLAYNDVDAPARMLRADWVCAAVIFRCPRQHGHGSAPPGWNREIHRLCTAHGAAHDPRRGRHRLPR